MSHMVLILGSFYTIYAPHHGTDLTLLLLDQAAFNAMNETPDARLIAPKNSPTIRYLETNKAYDLWSEIYDSDGNFLQALDTIEMQELLPWFVENLNSDPPWKLVDLGCGTGRNTKILLRIPKVEVIGLDSSPKMLEVARRNLEVDSSSPRQCDTPILEVYDLVSNLTPPPCALQAHGIISTLVLEHVPISSLFKAASAILKRDGILLMTNMHSEMGDISQAGFMDPATGEKIRPTSYAHRVEDVVAEANRQGFQIIGEVLERSVEKKSVQILGPRSKKWVGVKVWFAMLLRKSS